MKILSAVAISGAVGCSLRYWISLQLNRPGGTTLPWGTFSVNILGCLMIGLMIELLPDDLLGGNDMKIACISGLLGGFTTFSAFSLDTIRLLQNGYYQTGLINIGLHVFVGLFATWAGLSLGRNFV